MSRELQDKADIIIKELKEALIPLTEEIRKMKYGQNADEMK
jgi:hypothetical protein